MLSSRQARGSARTLLVLFSMCLGLTLPASAQYTGGTGGGTSTSPVGNIPGQEAMKLRATQARWRLGPLRLAPWYGLRNASLVSGTDADTDFTASFGAGLKGYVRSGDHVLLAGHFLPEYTWWAEDSERSGVDGRAGVALFTYFNRLATELSYRGSELQELFSSETEELAVQRQRTLRAAVELALTAKISLALLATDTAFELDEGRQTLARLDRDEERQSLRLSYRPRDAWDFELGYETGRDDFDGGGVGGGGGGLTTDLSNELEALVLEVDYTGNRIGANLELADRSLEPTAGSNLAATDVTTYRGIVFLEASRRLGLAIDWRRDLSYAVAAAAELYLADRLGFRAQTHLGPARLGLLVETGSDDYRAEGDVLRSDDVITWGGELGLQLRQALRLTVGARHSTYDSTLDAFDRDVTVFATGIELGAVPDWLRPRGDGDW